MTTLTLNFNDNEMEIIKEYMKVNKISMADLPGILTSFLTIEKYNNETKRVIEEVENGIGLSKTFTSIKDLFNYLDTAIVYNDVINVNTKKGNAVIISEAEYNGLLETLYLLSIPSMKEKLIDGLNASVEDCEELEW